MPTRGATLVGEDHPHPLNRTGSPWIRYVAPGNGGETAAVYWAEGRLGQGSRIHSAPASYRAPTVPDSLPSTVWRVLVPINADASRTARKVRDQRLHCQEPEWRVKIPLPPHRGDQHRKDNTLEHAQRNFLRALLNAPGPSGYESIPARIWREEAAKWADDVDHDVIGNSYAMLKAEGTELSVAIVGHIDEIGFLITHIDEQGYLWIEKVGGWDDQVVVGSRVVIVTARGEVRGVIGKKAAHLLKDADRQKITTTDQLWIDIGAKDRAAAKERVEIGDPVVLDSTTLELNGDIWSSRSLDNRVGAFVALEVVRLLSSDRPKVNVIGAAVTQEEITFAGAIGLSNQRRPSVGIAVDVTHATDYPGASKISDQDIALGGGPTIARGASANPIVFRQLQAAAERLGINAPVEALPRNSGTDADAMRSAGMNIAPGVISVPTRYMHSPNETVHLDDIDNAARLIAEFIRSLTPESDFRP